MPKNAVIVYAEAMYKGKNDTGVKRKVYIDGIYYGEVSPKRVFDLNPGVHSIYVEYTERVGERFFSATTDVATFSADDCSVVYSCYKSETSFTVYTNPLRYLRGSDADEVEKIMNKPSGNEEDDNAGYGLIGFGILFIIGAVAGFFTNDLKIDASLMAGAFGLLLIAFGVLRRRLR